MAVTPEGRTKAAIKKVLSEFPHYGYWPVPAGYGESTLDYVGCINGRAFLIEAKAPGKKPTDRQKQIIGAARRAGARVFVIDNVESDTLTELATFLHFWSRRPFLIGEEP
jgi:hypothetical protein